GGGLGGSRHLGDTALYALEQRLLIDAQFDDGIKQQALASQHTVERRSLRNGTGETVENKPVTRVRFCNPLADDADHQAVRRQTSACNDVLDFATDRSCALNRFPELSPVESWTIPYLAGRRWACVPLPAPGGPSRINLIAAAPAISIALSGPHIGGPTDSLGPAPPCPS